MPTDTSEPRHAGAPWLVIRAAVGGVLMGLANLVPGISGGTMLLAAGVYPDFVESVAAATRFTRRLQPWLTIAAIGIPAVCAIGLLAGTVRDAVLMHRWIAYSLFIGLTLGGAPTLVRMLRPISPKAGISAAIAFVGMVSLALAQAAAPEAASEGGGGAFGLFLAGFAGAAAMVLPGVSGGYLLLLLGQYVPVLDAISAATEAVRSGSVEAVLASATPLVAIAVGVGIGVVLVSNLVRWLLIHQPDATLGALLGLLLGAVAGLWPFREAIPPVLGDVVRGRPLETAEMVAEVALKDWPTQGFSPTLLQVGIAVVLVGLGFGASLLVGRLGGAREATPEA